MRYLAVLLLIGSAWGQQTHSECIAPMGDSVDCWMERTGPYCGLSLEYGLWSLRFGDEREEMTRGVTMGE
jgi:hypothetical protein